MSSHPQQDSLSSLPLCIKSQQKHIDKKNESCEELVEMEMQNVGSAWNGSYSTTSEYYN